MMKKILIISVLMNILLVSIFIYNLKNMDTSILGDSSFSGDEGNNELLKNKKNFCDVLLSTPEGDIESTIKGLSSEQYPNDVIFDLFSELLNVSSDVGSQKDWITLENIMVNQNCDKSIMNSQNYEICKMIKNKDLEGIKSFDNIPKTQGLLMESVLKGQNMCGEDFECNRIWELVESIKKKDMDFPNLSGGYKLIDLYAYEKLFPEKYGVELWKGIKKICSNEGS